MDEAANGRSCENAKHEATGLSGGGVEYALKKRECACQSEFDKEGGGLISWILKMQNNYHMKI